MITSRALVHGDAERLLAFDPSEHPVAVQLGGNEPDELAAAARLAADAGYDEINLNVGCPSSRVQAGAFGARLMLEPDRVADCVAAMREAAGLPVTVKTRIGVDEHDSYEILQTLTARVVAAGAECVIVHARKAWLSGLSPKENREIPPLDYERVYRLKADFPQLPVWINGGFTTAAQVLDQKGRVDGVMLGRSAYQEPMLISALDRAVHGGESLPGLSAILDRYADYMRRERAIGTPVRSMSRHLLGLVRHRPGARRWRRWLAELDAESLDDSWQSELTSLASGTRYNARSVDIITRQDTARS